MNKKLKLLLWLDELWQVPPKKIAYEIGPTTGLVYLVANGHTVAIAKPEEPPMEWPLSVQT